MGDGESMNWGEGRDYQLRYWVDPLIRLVSLALQRSPALINDSVDRRQRRRRVTVVDVLLGSPYIFEGNQSRRSQVRSLDQLNPDEKKRAAACIATLSVNEKINNLV